MVNLRINLLDSNNNNNNNNLDQIISNLNNPFKIQQILKDNTKLPQEQIDSIIKYMKEKLVDLTESANKNQIDLHLRSKDTGLPLPIEIKKDGEALLVLKKWGKELGKGNYRKTKLAIILSDKNLPLVAHSTQEFGNSKIDLKKAADTELLILNKVSCFLEQNPEEKGLMRFLNSVDYRSKKPAEPESDDELENSSYEDGFDSTDIENRESNSFESSEELEFNEKRAVATKFYNGGNLQDSLPKLSVGERIEAGKHLLAGLKHLHKMGIFHSDIKLDNIFLEKDASSKLSEAVIGDFGFACDLTVKEDRFFKNGDRDIRPPELLMDKNFKKGCPINEGVLSSDVYAMGLVLKSLFADVNPNHVPYELHRLIAGMTSYEPLNRPSAEEAEEMYHEAIALFEKTDTSQIPTSSPEKYKDADYEGISDNHNRNSYEL